MILVHFKELAITDGVEFKELLGCDALQPLLLDAVPEGDHGRLPPAAVFHHCRRPPAKKKRKGD